MMKKPILHIVICVFLILGHYAQAQQAVYTKTIANYNSDFMLPVADNGLFVFGDSTFIFKLNSAGNFQWAKSYHFPGSNFSVTTRFYEAIYDQDSNIVVTGQTSKNPNNGHAFILKLKQNGDTLWCRKLSDPNIISFVPYDVTTCFDSTYVITGCAISANTPTQVLFVGKISNRGNIVWLKKYGNFTNVGYAIQQSPDSGFVISGASPLFGFSSFLLTKLNKNGNHQWSKEFYTSPIRNHSTMFDISVNKNDFAVLSSDGAYPYLMNFDYNGNRKWGKVYLDNVFFDYDFESDLRLRRTLDGGFLIINKNIFYPDSWVIHTDSIGNLRWKSRFFSLSKIDAVQNKNKSFSIIGNRALIVVNQKFKSLNNFLPDIQLFKTDSLGKNLSDCINSDTTIVSNIFNSATSKSLSVISLGQVSSIKPQIRSFSIVTNEGCLFFSGGFQSNNLSSINLYPNPAFDKIIFESSQFIGKKINVQLIDLTGKIILNQNSAVENENTEIDCRNIQNGIYILRIFEPGVFTRIEKLIIAH